MSEIVRIGDESEECAALRAEVEQLHGVAGSTDRRGKTRSTEDAVRRVMALRERAIKAESYLDEVRAEVQRLRLAIKKAGSCLTRGRLDNKDEAYEVAHAILSAALEEKP